MPIPIPRPDHDPIPIPVPFLPPDRTQVRPYGAKPA